jgi:hypothetical protein
MKFQGAVVKEQGVTFGIVVVTPQVLQTDYATDEMIQFGKRAFGPIPIVLMAQDSRGRPSYKGRPDIVKFLASIDYHRIPWKEYTLA